MSVSSDAPESEGFDQVLERLRATVEKLEQGSLTLEAALGIFEEGIALARRGHALLDAAEKRVEILLRDGTAPFRGEGSSSGAG